MVVPDALKVLRMAHGRRFCKLGDLASAVGWRHASTIKELEAKRKERSAEYFKAAKKLAIVRAKAAKSA